MVLFLIIGIALLASEAIALFIHSGALLNVAMMVIFFGTLIAPWAMFSALFGVEKDKNMTKRGLFVLISAVSAVLVLLILMKKISDTPNIVVWLLVALIAVCSILDYFETKEKPFSYDDPDQPGYESSQYQEEDSASEPKEGNE
jgi:undecaprenyl pyrophosphate phosphatase UppP